MRYTEGGTTNDHGSAGTDRRAGYRRLDGASRRADVKKRDVISRSAGGKRKKNPYALFLPVILVSIAVLAVCITAARSQRAKGSDTGEPSDIMEETTPVSVSSDTGTAAVTEDISVPEHKEEPEDPPEKEHITKSSISFFDGYSVKRNVYAGYIGSEEVISDAAVLVDADSGEIVAERDGAKVIAPASMTKVLTILVAAEHITPEQLEDTVEITIDMTDYSYSNDLTIAGFDVGEKPTVRDLFYGTILPSGADASVALATFVAGSHEAFVMMMNDKCRELGLSVTAHFTNCVGVYDDDHHCSLIDMAMIMKAAVENDFCREVLSAHKYTTSSTPEHPEGIELSNWFLRRIEDKDTHGEVVCGKTGFVKESGCCAVSYAVSNDGHRYFLVTSNAWSTWRCIYDQVEIYSEYTD